MLENYYGLNKNDKFEEIFGKLYIGENPTPEHNKYLIVHLNFAEIDAGLDDYRKGLDAHLSPSWTTMVVMPTYSSLRFAAAFWLGFLTISA